MTKPRRLCIIPARGGSKRIKNKNIKNFCGKPMIYHSLNNATTADIFSKIHVSTDSSSIAKTVNSAGHEIDFMRPKSLSDDYATIFEVLIFVFETYEKQSQIFDEIWLLMACAPLIQPKNLVEASNIFDASKGPLVAVSELPVPIDWAYKKNEEGCLTLHNPSAHATRSQDLKKYYFVMFKKRYLLI